MLAPMAREVGLGAMRLSTDPARDDERGIEVLRAGVRAGVTLIDTAPSYGLGEHDLHHSERLVARALAGLPVEARARVRVATKCGMRREGAAYVPAGKRASILASIEASVAALGGPLDLALLHTPDPEVPLPTSVRAMVTARDRGLVRAIGVSNVNGRELEIARAEAELEAVQVELGAHSSAMFRSALPRLAAAAGLLVLAHSPLGGAQRAARTSRDPQLLALARELSVTPAELLLAWLCDLSPQIVPLPGAQRCESAVGAARAQTLALPPHVRSALDQRFSAGPKLFRPPPTPPRGDAEVVMIMGIMGGGKTRHAHGWVERGYERLNRDERGGTIAKLAQALDAALAQGGKRFVLDNTFPTRASRALVTEVAARRGARVRCLEIAVPLEVAQAQAVERLLSQTGELPSPEALHALARTLPNAFAPTAQHRYLREREPPREDEGLDEIQSVDEPRSPPCYGDRSAILLGFDALLDPALEAARQSAARFDHTLVFGWLGERDERALRGLVSERLPRADVEIALCTHAGGPPRCWCRPPLPGLPVAFLRARKIDPKRSLLLVTSSALDRLGRALGLETTGPASVTQG